MEWIIKFTNSHLALIEYELEYLMVESEIKKINDVVFLVNCSYDKMKYFHRYSSLGRFILNSPRFFDTNHLYDELFNPDLIYPIFDDTSKFEYSMECSMAVRFFQIGKKDKVLKSPMVERKISKALFSRQSQYTIDLRSPDHLYHVYRMNDLVVSGWVAFSIPFSDVQKRAPMNSPYFGGGALKPHLSRALVNLLQPLDCYILDPFSGHGGLLREVAEMGKTAIGFEINRKISLECKANNYYHGFQDMVHLVTCDALSPPLRKKAIHSAISDPPYGIQTTTIGRNRDELVKSWMDNQTSKMEFVFCVPTEMLNNISDNWDISVDVLDYVHRTLTRRIRKITKND